MLEYNAWVAVCKDKQETHEMIHLNPLKKTPAPGFITVDFGKAYTQHYTISDLNSHFQANPLISSAEVAEKVTELQSKDPYVVYRGKYEFNYLIDLLNFIRTKANRKSPESRNSFEREMICWDVNAKHWDSPYSN